jgi:OmpA-OmpF porin, OOP family
VRKVCCILLFLFAWNEIYAQVASYWPGGVPKERGKYSKRYSMVYDLDGKLKNRRARRGTWKFYYRNGKMAKKERYQRGKERSNLPVGTWRYYDSLGNLMRVQRFGSPGEEKTSRFERAGTYDWEGLRWEVERIGHDSFQINEYHQGKLHRSMFQFHGDLLIRTALSGVGRPMQLPPIKERGVLPVHNPDIWADENKWHLDARNLVSNPSFEHTSVNWPELTAISIADTLIDYWKPASGTPDFIRGKRASARTGTAIAGLRVYARGAMHIEYIQNRLREPLKKDSLYCVRIHYRLSDRSLYAADAVGLAFSRDSFRFYRYEASGLQPHIINRAGQILYYKDRWMQLSGEYRALGGEQFLTLGGFRPLDSIHLVRTHKGSGMEAYYFIDDLSVIPAGSEACSVNTRSLPPVEQGTAVSDAPDTLLVLDQVQFAVNAAAISAESVDELQELADWLLRNAAWGVRIMGHTDSSGNEARNISLSRQRAEAIEQWLSAKGIDAHRMESTGYGSSRPRVPNNTVENRALNRRVEVAFYKLD